MVSPPGSLSACSTADRSVISGTNWPFTRIMEPVEAGTLELPRGASRKLLTMNVEGVRRDSSSSRHRSVVHRRNEERRDRSRIKPLRNGWCRIVNHVTQEGIGIIVYLERGARPPRSD